MQPSWPHRPCCEAIVAAGIARVVCAMGDPNPLVAGQGLAYLRSHGVEVIEGVGAARAARDHRGHVAVVTRDRPMVTLKLAETANGFVAGGPYDPRLSITGVAANGVVHVMRAMHDAIMVGIGTILADDPLMTVRLPGVVAKPLRIVLDKDARIPPRSRLIETARDVPVLVVMGTDAPIERGRGDHGLGRRHRPRDGLRRGWAARSRAGARRARRAGHHPCLQRGRPDRRGCPDRRRSRSTTSTSFTAARPLVDGGVATLPPDARAALGDPARFRAGETSWIGPDRLGLLGKSALMFTGLVSDVGTVAGVEDRGALRRLRIACGYRPDTIALGASIACNGPCLTAVAIGPHQAGAWFDVDVGAETLDRTSAGRWSEGTRLNLERSLKIGDELGGHLVTGHVDGTAEILAVTPFDGMSRFEIQVPRDLARFIAEKGSVRSMGPRSPSTASAMTP